MGRYASQVKRPLSEIAIIDETAIADIVAQIITSSSGTKIPIVSNTEPENPIEGDLWIDTSE